MSVYKVIARCPKTKRQQIKKIYENDIKFNLYGKDTANRYQSYHNVEVYKMDSDGDYNLIYELKMPTTIEGLQQYSDKMNYGESWVGHRFRDLSLQK